MASNPHIHVDELQTEKIESTIEDNRTFLVQLYEKKLATDFTIEIGDKLIHGHKSILSAAIPYFASMFSTGLTEAETGRAVLKDIDPDALEMIIRYVYTGSLEINRKNWEDLMVAANYLQYKQIIDHCCNYLKKHFDSDKVFKVRHLSKMMNIPELIHIWNDYINGNFEAICERSEIQEFSFDEFADIISRDELQIDSELKVFKCLMKWLKHDQDGRKSLFVQLFKRIRLNLISKEDLLNCVANENSVVSEKECNEYIYKALSYHIFPDARGDSRDLWIAKRSKKLEEEVIYIVGGELDIKYRPMMEILRMQPFSSTFQHARDNWIYHGTLVRSEYLYIIGGFENGVVTNRVIALNLKTRSYSDFPSMNVKRYRFATALLNDVMYVCGGKDHHDQVLNSVEFYCPIKKKWMMAGSMLAPRWGHAAVVLDGSIHVVGGQGVKFSEQYDHGRNVWTQVATMNSQRHDLGAVVDNGKIIIAGGFAAGKVLDSSEIYDPQQKTWISLSNMKVSREGLFLVKYQSKVYAIGGRDGFEHDLSSIEQLQVRHDQRLSELIRGTHNNPYLSSWTLLNHRIAIPRWGASVQVVKI